jgi:hypothetical protein
MSENSIDKRKKAPSKVDNVFVIQILNQEYGTWQGRVTWADRNKTKYFRSALELIKLVEGALGSSDFEIGFDDESEELSEQASLVGDGRDVNAG